MTFQNFCPLFQTVVFLNVDFGTMELGDSLVADELHPLIIKKQTNNIMSVFIVISNLLSDSGVHSSESSSFTYKVVNILNINISPQLRAWLLRQYNNVSLSVIFLPDKAL